MAARVGGEDRGKGQLKSLGWTCTRCYILRWITNKHPLYSTCNSAQCYVAAWMGGEFGAQWICVCVCVYG